MLGGGSILKRHGVLLPAPCHTRAYLEFPDPYGVLVFRVCLMCIHSDMVDIDEGLILVWAYSRMRMSWAFYRFHPRDSVHTRLCEQKTAPEVLASFGWGLFGFPRQAEISWREVGLWVCQ